MAKASEEIVVKTSTFSTVWAQLRDNTKADHLKE